jgi:hypothetical protein
MYHYKLCTCVSRWQPSRCSRNRTNICASWWQFCGFSSDLTNTCAGVWKSWNVLLVPRQVIWLIWEFFSTQLILYLKTTGYSLTAHSYLKSKFIQAHTDIKRLLQILVFPQVYHTLESTAYNMCVWFCKRIWVCTLCGAPQMGPNLSQTSYHGKTTTGQQAKIHQFCNCQQSL